MTLPLDPETEAAIERIRRQAAMAPDDEAADAEPEATSPVGVVGEVPARRPRRRQPPGLRGLGLEQEPDDGGGGEPLTFLSADEALALAPERPEWVWDDFLAKGAVTLLAGLPKRAGGKSTFAWALVAAILRGEGTFVGRAVIGGGVVYLTEEPLAFLRHKLIGLAGVAGLSLVCRDNAPRPKPEWADSIRQATTRAVETGAVVLVIDTFAEWAAAAAEAEKDSGAMQAAMGALAEAAAAGLAILLIHHHRKSGAGEDGEAVRGSNAIVGAANVVIDLKRLEEGSPPRQRILNASSHWPGTPESLIVELRGDGHGYDLVTAGERETVQAEATAAKITGALNDGAETRKQIETATGLSRSRVGQVLPKMEAKGTVRRIETSGRNNPDLYRLTSMATPSDSPPSDTLATGRASLLLLSPFRGDSNNNSLSAFGGGSDSDDSDDWRSLLPEDSGDAS